MLLGHGIELLQQPITMLLLVGLLHLVQSSQDTVPQHAVLMKPHSPKSFGEATIDLIFLGHSSNTWIDISICISQPYPQVIGAGIVIQFREGNLLIQVVIKGTILLLVLLFPGGTGFRY